MSPVFGRRCANWLTILPRQDYSGPRHDRRMVRRAMAGWHTNLALAGRAEFGGRERLASPKWISVSFEMRCGELDGR